MKPVELNPAELFRQEKDAVELPPGQALFREGDAGSDMYVLLEGTMDIVIGDFVVESLWPGALIGEMALIDNSPRAATAVATTNCKLAKINQRRFHFLVQQTPFFASHVMKVLVDRVRKMNRQLVKSEMERAREHRATVTEPAGRPVAEP